MQSLPERVADWPEAERELYEERAAILEFEGGLPRAEAEMVAEQMIRGAVGIQGNLL